MSKAPAEKGPFVPRQLQLFGEYAIEAPIEEGPTWAVYSARHVQRLEEHYFARILRGMNASDRNVVEAFARQSFLLESLKHPGIIPVVAAGVDQGMVFIIMQEVRGETLAARLARSEPFDPAESVRLVREIADVLDYLHRHVPPVFHRALDPTKILLAEPDGRVKLLEVGYAHALEEVSRVEPIGNLPRAPDGFRAPEDVPGAIVGSSVDQFALACIARECIARSGPAASALKAATDSALRRALSPDPNARFPSSGALAQALHDAIIPATRPAATAAKPATDAKPAPGAKPPGPQRTISSQSIPRPSPAANKPPAVGTSPLAAPPVPRRHNATIVGTPPPHAATPPLPAPSPALTPLQSQVASNVGSAPMPAVAPAVAPAVSPSAGATLNLAPAVAPAAFVGPATSGTTAKWAPVGGHLGPAAPAGRTSLAPEPIAPSHPPPHAETKDDLPEGAVTHRAIPSAELLRAIRLPGDQELSFGEDEPETDISVRPPTDESNGDDVAEISPEEPAVDEPLFAPERPQEPRLHADAKPITALSAAAPVPDEPLNSVPPRDYKTEPPPAKQAPRSSRAAIILGVSIVLAALIYTLGFTLRPVLMALVTHGNAPPAPTAAPGVNTSVVHADGEQHATQTPTMAPAPAVAPPDAQPPAHTEIATSSPDAGATQLPAPITAEAPDAAQRTPPPPSTAVATNTTATAAASPGGALPQRPSWRDRHNAEERIVQHVAACPGHVGRHARVAVTYAGPTGRASVVHIAGSAFTGLPIGACIEQAIRDAAMPPFTDPTWSTDYTFAVH